jgi:hypothetical protein
MYYSVARPKRADVSRQEATAMRGQQPQARMPVQGAREDQVRQGERRLGRLTERVAKEVRAKTGAEAAAPGVDEDHGDKGRGRLPYRLERRVGELAAVDVRRDAHTLEPEHADSTLQLADRQVRMLQRQRAELVKAASARGAVRGDGLVDHGGELARQR